MSSSMYDAACNYEVLPVSWKMSSLINQLLNAHAPLKADTKPRKM